MNVPDRTTESKAITMIPTGHKVKIPNTLSYPLGTKAIFEALEGVPQIDSLLVDFWFWNRQRHPLISLRPYRVLSVSYWHAAENALYRKSYIEAGLFDPCWRITVEPVPRSLRHSVQTKLLAESAAGHETLADRQPRHGRQNWWSQSHFSF
jgi:hypothetical protein